MRGAGSGSPLTLLPLLILLPLLCLLSESSRGQAFEPTRSDPTSEVWRTTHYDDLRGRGVYAIAGGGDERVWFATSAGVVSYDGLKWESWTIDDGLLDDRVTAILELKDGTILAGGRMGLTRYADGHWTTILGRHSGPYWVVSDLAAGSDGSVWAATIWGALRLRGERRTLYCTAAVKKALQPYEADLEFELLPEAILPRGSWRAGAGLKLTSKGDGWLITAVAEASAAEEAGLAIGDRILAMREASDAAEDEIVYLVTYEKWNGTIREVEIPREDHQGSHHVFRALSVTEGPDGRIYLGARRGSVYAFDPSLESTGAPWTRILSNNPRNNPARVTTCLDGSVWANSEGLHSLVRIDSEERETLETPTDRGVQRLAGDADGSLWVLSDDGLYSTSGDGWQAHDGANGHGESRELYLQPSGVLWLSDHRAGITRIEVGTHRLDSYRDLRYLCRTAGETEWFLTAEGDLLERSGENWIRHPRPAIFGDKDEIDDGMGLADGDVLLYSTSVKGVKIARWSGDGWKEEGVPGLGIVRSRCNPICEDTAGRLWVGPGLDGLGRAGVAIGENESWRFLYSPLIQGSARDIVATGDGAVWLGTSRGLYRVFEEVIEEVVLPWRPARGGVSSLCTDADGRLWVGSTARGMYLREGGEWRRFRSAHQPRNHVMDLQCTEDGTLWAATHAGLCRLDEGEWWLVQRWFRSDGVRLRPTTGGAIWIHKFWDAILFRPEAIPPETWLNTGEDTMARPGPMYLSWGGRDRWRPEGQDEMAWSYRIDGGEWSPFSTETRHIVPELAVGSHDLEVRSRDSAFNIDPSPAYTRVDVVLSIWRRTWFQLLVGAFLLTVFVQAIRMARRDRRLRETHERAATAEAAKERFEAEVAARLEAEEARRRVEAELIQSRKMEAMGQLAGGIAHDFNNILTAIWGNASELSHLLENGPHRDPQAIVALEGIHTAADRAAALTRQLLMVGQPRIRRPEVLDPNAIIETTSRMLERVLEEHVHLEFLPGEDVGAIIVDRSMFEQVVMNLVVNARDAMPGGGQITVRTEGVRLDEGVVAPHPGCEPGTFVKLVVEDDGEGMSEERMERVFDPFFTTKAPGKGTGLGLSTVFAIARQGRGFVTVSSQVGVGSRFEVYLPSSTESPEARLEEVRLAYESDGGTETVLVCEDDPTVREFVDRALERFGYEVLTASSGEDALELAASYDGPVELLLTDVIMPGINGPELAGAIRARRPKIKVLYMSGHPTDVLENRSELAEETVLLQKPFTTKTLLERVQEVLEPA